MNNRGSTQMEKSFHPVLQSWFDKTFAQPTEAQQQAWPAIQSGQHVLLAAPTGSGKTMAAFLSAIDRLLRQGLAQQLTDVTRVLYISPLKALSNDIQCNLQAPLQGIRNELKRFNLPDVDIRAWVRTGDTPQAERRQAIRTPPHILVTTPESVYILLTSASGRHLLSGVETVIIDEIHAVAGDKRGAHLALSLERLHALTLRTNQQAPKRIGLSATQKPIETIARFLVGQRQQTCTIIDTGHTRQRDLALELPGSPLQAVMSNEIWDDIYNRLEALARAHHTTLIFANTRRLVERATRALAERLGQEQVMAHHGSMSKAHRLQAEQRLKSGTLKCLVATSSLELGIDIGDIDLVCQLGSPRSISAFLQRVGRSGHSLSATPKGRIFPLSRDELVEATALLHAVAHGELDRITIPQQPLDVLAQQIVAEISAGEWDEAALYALFRQAWPYRNLSSETFNTLVRMLADGYATRRGRRGAYLHYDAINARLRPRRNARLTAITNGGVIPDLFDYEVILTPEDIRIGTLGEDFAFESMPGDIFQLGHTSYRVLKVEQGKVFVADAKGEPPNIPFWFGEMPGRSDELSAAVSQLRSAMNEQLMAGETHTQTWLQAEYALCISAAEQLTAYLGAAKAALGVIPTQAHIVLERFFDETNDMHLVIHAPFGSRINRAWGLALRKRFCRKFNFELQAAALEDSLVLSLSTTHSFPLEEVTRYLHAASVRDLLIQALLAAPMFPTRWRWNACIALAVPRFRNGKRAPPYFQRADAEDLVAVVFPDQIACGENIAGDREVPDHPLVQQTIQDCLQDTMDIHGLERLLTRLENGDIENTCCDLTAPSPLAQEILNARPYAFLDDAPAEERRTMAVRSRAFITPGDAADLGKLDHAAIDKVCEEAKPIVRDADELHDALLVFAYLTAAELPQAWTPFYQQLQHSGRALQLTIPAGQTLTIATERQHEFHLLHPTTVPDGITLTQQQTAQTVTNHTDALQEIIRSRLELLGPVTATQLAAPLALTEQTVHMALLALEQEGFVVRGQFRQSESDEMQWCERRLLARIHRYTLNRLRNEIEAVSAQDYMRFLLHWQGVTEPGQGLEAVAAVLDQLEGFSAAAGAWETELLSARIALYTSDLLDALCATGRTTWLRLMPRANAQSKKNPPVRQSPMSLIHRHNLPHWQNLTTAIDPDRVSQTARKVLHTLEQHGASFFSDLVRHTGLLKTTVENALGELVSCGLATADHFAGLRALITPNNRKSRLRGRGRQRQNLSPFDAAGRWSLIPQTHATTETNVVQQTAIAFLADVFLRRYGIVFRKVLEREALAPPWRELLREYWRMEACGDIRGGRFVQGVSGEQFALPDAIGALRKVRKQPHCATMFVVSGVDPLNLVGVILPGEKVTASLQHRIVIRDGLAIAVQNKQTIDYLAPLDAHVQVQVNRLLRQSRGGPVLTAALGVYSNP